MKLIKKQISGITYFSIDNLSIELDVSKRYNLNLWSEGTQKQGTYTKTLYFDDTLAEWRTRDCECSNKDKSLDFLIVIENNVLISLETLKIYGIDNGGVHIFNEVYFELYEIGSGGSPTPTDLPISYYEVYDASKIIEGYLTYFNVGNGRGLFYKNQNGQIKKLFTIGEYPDGYFTDANFDVGTNTLNIFRENRPPLPYKPIIKSYTYSNTDTHSFNIDEEKFWTLTIPSTSFGENTNVLNVRIGTVDTSNSGHLRNSFISTWEITNNNNLSVRIYMKNTLGIQLDVVNVSLIIETI